MSLVVKFFDNGGYNLAQMDWILTAQEAYAKTKDYWANLYTFEEIMKSINAAILFGKFTIGYSGILMEPVAEKLRELGYEVCVNTDDPFDPYFSINWLTMLEKE